MRIVGNTMCNGALPIIAGVHRGIPKVMGLVRLYENIFKENFLIPSDKYDVGLVPTIK